MTCGISGAVPKLKRFFVGRLLRGIRGSIAQINPLAVVAPSGKHTNSDIENGLVEIVDLAMKKWLDLSSSLSGCFPCRVNPETIPKEALLLKMAP